MRYAADGSAFLQHPISRCHGVAAETKLLGQLSFTGQTIAGQEPAESDLLFEIPRDLSKQEIVFASHQAKAIRCGRHR